MGTGANRGLGAQFDGVTSVLGASRREPMGPGEVAAALAWKGRFGGGWQAVATYCGRPVDEVRRACQAVMAGTVVKATPAPPPKRTDGEVVLELLAETAMSVTDLTRALSWKWARTEAVVEALLSSGAVETRRSRGGGRLVGLKGTFVDKPAPSPPAPSRGPRVSLRADVLDLLARGPSTSLAVAEALKVERTKVGPVLSQMVADGSLTIVPLRGVRLQQYALPGWTGKTGGAG